ncbi:Cyclic di-GMP phosphodiesterase PdeB [Granulosicoccus antarcticus IMCC3135]|uniref:Cyclic di-GMP phosphodiesterase PdeB n=2 Tax=Granulosicoccus TaxID=437504 RepID=A0A2Z2P698_9GAMM|nr:Cyclic di-GMP phosphodiesterase PdeB [Granulosicoccus antarcticus IMCC3135]
MLIRGGVLGQGSDRVALKDERLIYRACSMAFALSVGRGSPDEVIGRTDFDLFSGEIAREQMALDSQAIFSAQADISAIRLDSLARDEGQVQAMIVRTPIITSDNKVRGIDIRLIGGPQLNLPNSAVTIDYQTLVNDGIQGSLIIDRTTILFANDMAARVLGYPSAQALMENGQVSELFSAQELQRATRMALTDQISAVRAEEQRINLQAQSQTGSLVRLIARVTQVQWGQTQATLLSFVDVAITQQPQNVALAMRAGELKKQLAEMQRIRANEQRYRHYASAAADFFWELDAKLTFRVASDGLARVLGITRENIVGRTIDQLLDHPANINTESHWAGHLKQLRACRPFRDFEFRWSVGGETRVVRYSGIPVFNQAREFVGYRGVGCDVTASVRQAETTAYHASHDALTGLVNRRSFESTVQEALVASRLTRQAHALCFMDLDSFKIVNDTCGHQAGDELLRQLTQLFDSLVRKSDVLARLGGDEFGVLLYKCGVPEALKLANQIRHEVENFQFLWHENRFTIGVSVGLVVVDDRWESIQSLFGAVDSACYIAKNEGRNRVVVYREGEGNASNRKVSTHWVEEINAALETGRLRLACQRIMPLNKASDGLRFEMLLRLELPNGELIVPQAFLPSAERYGLVSALDERAIELTLSWLSANSELLHNIRHVSINLSAGSFTDAQFCQRLVKSIASSPVPASKLCFEIAETAAITNLSKVSAFMHELSAIGCRFGIDDFGSGLSSFAYLRKLPVDFLKIDGLLIKDILDDETDFTLVKAISDISKSLGKRTVAEFIESPQLLDAVREIGIDFGQGFHLGEPELIS